MIVNNEGFNALADALDGLAELNAKPILTKRDEQRMSGFMAIISALKAGNSAGELRRWQQERLAKLSGELAPPARGTRGRLDDDLETEYRKYATTGEARSACVPSDKEIRANQAGSETISYTSGIPGGYFSPAGIHDRFFQNFTQWDQVYEPWASHIVETPTGGLMTYPGFNDVGNPAVQVGEAVQGVEVDLGSFSLLQLNAYSFRSRPVGLSIEWLQDENYPVGSVLEAAFSLRLALGIGKALINGSGVASPTGLLTAVLSSGAKVIVAAGSSVNDGSANTGSNSIGSTDINTAYHALDRVYRSHAVWYMNDSTVQALEGQLDKYGRPLVQWEGLKPAWVTDADPDNACPYLYRLPVAICNSMPSIGPTQTTVILAAPHYFVQRRVPSSCYLRRYQEKPGFIENGIIGFEAWMRIDSGFASGSSNVPAVAIQQHS
jgi:HK97 family phage major capsid protein